MLYLLYSKKAVHACLYHMLLWRTQMWMYACMCVYEKTTCSHSTADNVYKNMNMRILWRNLNVEKYIQDFLVKKCLKISLQIPENIFQGFSITFKDFLKEIQGLSEIFSLKIISKCLKIFKFRWISLKKIENRIFTAFHLRYFQRIL